MSEERSGEFYDYLAGHPRPTEQRSEPEGPRSRVLLGSPEKAKGGWGKGAESDQARFRDHRESPEELSLGGFTHPQRPHFSQLPIFC